MISITVFSLLAISLLSLFYLLFSLFLFEMPLEEEIRILMHWMSEWKSLSCVWLFATPWLYSPWNSPGQNTGVGSLSLLQGIFPSQGLNPGLTHCRHILYQLSHKGSPRILEWVAYPFSSGSSWPRNGAQVSGIAGRFFTNWAIREAPCIWCIKETSMN